MDAEIEEGVTLEETTDTDFVPDVRVGDGEVAAMGDGWTIARCPHAGAHVQSHVLRPRRGARAVHR